MRATVHVVAQHELRDGRRVAILEPTIATFRRLDEAEHAKQSIADVVLAECTDLDNSDRDELTAGHFVGLLEAIVGTWPLDVPRYARWAGRIGRELTPIDLDEVKAAIFDATPNRDTARKAMLAGYCVSDTAAEDKPSKLAPARHSDDFRSVEWYGAKHDFTTNQAACVKVLWEHCKRGTPDVGQDTILESANVATKRLDHLFRGHSAWGTMIVPGSTKGAYRLAENKFSSVGKLHT